MGLSKKWWDKANLWCFKEGGGAPSMAELSVFARRSPWISRKKLPHQGCPSWVNIMSDGKWTILGNRLGHTGTYISSFSRFPSKLKNDEPANAGIVQTMSHNSGHGGFNPSPNYVWHHQSVSQSVTSPVLLAIYPQISSAFLILSSICLDIRDLSPRQQAKNTHTCIYIYIYIYSL